MGQRFLYLLVVVFLGIWVGLAIVGKQASDPVMQRLLSQQEEIIKLQKKVAGTLVGDEAPAGQMSVTQLTLNQKDLERRIASLEKKIEDLSSGNNDRPSRRDMAGPPPEDMNKVYDIPVGNSYVRGSKDAAVTIVEFVDFQCPFCARFHAPTLEVLKAYPKDVNYMIKNFPLSFHPNAKPAAKAALAAGEQGKYYEMADMILENNTKLSEEDFKQHAKTLGLNVDKFLKDLKDKDAQWEKQIQDDIALATQVDVGGTPTFYINGKKTFARDLDSYKREIDAILGAKK